ncbi:glucuronate isomerase [Lachnospiraceae bacterium 54-53]
MKHQFSEELLLTNQTGSYFYHTYAKHLPIIDYHCHLVAREIYENKEFEDLGEMWLAHDHYKWRAMRTFGIDEHYITGGADYYEKYLKFAEILPRLIGNPVYIWCALELKRYFDIEEPLGPENGEEIYQKTKELIRERHMTPRWCMEQSKVELVSTTEDPVDTLEYHIRMKEDPAVKSRILTAFRPDKAFYCEWPSFGDYMEKLSRAAGQEITDFSSMMDALERRLSYFAQFGTRVSDNGMADITWCDYTAEEVEEVFARAMEQKKLSPGEINRYKSAFVIEMAKLYKKYDFVMQLHIGTYLDANEKKVRETGQSTGFDCVDDTTSVRSVGAVLNRLTELDQLPKTILYPLNASQVEAFAVLAAGFCDGSAKGKVQLGAPWWFNDQSYGIERQFYAAGNLYPVSLSVGMLTDSRSFLSYPRHELYRRILCSYFGELVERGEYFSDEKYIKEMIESVCYGNVKEYFGW